jgi:hypothetical protein
MPNANPTPERLELGLSRIFALCDRNRAAWLILAALFSLLFFVP